MKLGTQTGSLTNHVYSRMTLGAPFPKVGDGATVLCWTDRAAATVTDVVPLGKSHIVTVQEDIATRVDNNGMSESQEYRYQTNHDGRVYHFKRTPDGNYFEVRFNRLTYQWNRTKGVGLLIGRRETYHDFSF
jgi:hypothetical protein